MTYGERVLDALGDPTRRMVFKRVRGGGPTGEGLDAGIRLGALVAAGKEGYRAYDHQCYGH